LGFLELTRNRYSVRGYSERKVEKEKIDKILEACNNAHGILFRRNQTCGKKAEGYFRNSGISVT